MPVVCVGRQRLRRTRPGSVLDVRLQGRQLSCCAAFVPGWLVSGPGLTSPAVLAAVESRIITYHVCAGSLLHDYGLLLPVEFDTRLFSETELWAAALRRRQRVSRRVRYGQDPDFGDLNGVAGCWVNSRNIWWIPSSSVTPMWNWSGWCTPCLLASTRVTAAPASGCCVCWSPRLGAPCWCCCSTRWLSGCASRR